MSKRPDVISSQGLGLAPVTVEDYRRLAFKRLPRTLFDYVDGAAYQEISAERNASAFDDVLLRQRVLNDVSNISTQQSLLGRDWAQPLALAPVGLAGSLARRGECQAYLAALYADIPFALSTVGICSIEELAALGVERAAKPFWFQLYMLRDRALCEQLMQRAAKSGCDTLVLTVDLPLAGQRYRDVRNGVGIEYAPRLFGSASRLVKFSHKWRSAANLLAHPVWLWDVAIKGKPLVLGSVKSAVPKGKTPADFRDWVDAQFDSSLTWDDAQWVRERWQGKLVIKGIMDADDAVQAVRMGADAIVVSNHGGRQLDGVPATLDVLSAIKQAVVHTEEGKKQPAPAVLLDGGVRNGLDVFKALALGADACLMGRAWAFALAAQGEHGVRQLLKQTQSELLTAMALTGCTQLSDIDASRLCGENAIV